MIHLHASQCLFLDTESKISCSENNFYGEEEDTLIKPCHLLSNTFIRGNEIYKCYKKSWKLERNNCVSEQINSLLIRAEVTGMSFYEAGERG